MTTPALPYRLDRILTIDAPRDRVFRFFTTNDRWAAWWGAGSTIDPRVGGNVFIRLPGGVEVSGEVLEIAAPATITFTYGFVSGSPIPVGGSRVTIRLDAVDAATRLHLTHEFADEPARDHHVQGWRFQLSLFANVVANELHANAAALADEWFAAWHDPDEARRERALAAIASPDVSFRDRYSRLDGMSELLPHIAAAQRFMPGIRLERRGDVRHCQGTVLADWAVIGPDGTERGRGSQVFRLGAHGLIESATGLWG
jgi:uncharacterized protein YndB with AHSA1/START domain